MNKQIVKTCLAGLMAFATVASAQNSLTEKENTAVDLGYGVENNLAVTSAAVSVITAEELQQTSAINLADALYGRLLGLTALKNGGFSGDDNYGASFNIRGYQTLGDNSMLILVDGMPRPIDRLSVNEVESVTVLKDAAAVALLGYKGVNGAILVKTKRGNTEKVNVDVTYNHKFTFAPEIADFVDGYTYAQAMNEARSNDGLAPAYKDMELELFKAGTDPYYYPNVDWADEVMEDLGSEDQVNLSIHGGGAKVKYFTMLDYVGSRGMLSGTDQKDYNSQLKYSKANIRANIDFEVTPTTKMQVNMMASFIETNEPSASNANDIFYQIYRLPATAFPVQTPDGIWGGNQNYTDANPIARIQGTGYEKTHQRALYADARLTQKFDFITKGLSASVRMGYDNFSRLNEEHSKTFQYGYVYYTDKIGDPSSSESVIYGDKINSLSFNRWLGNQYRSSHFDVSVDYERQFDAHSVAASAIYNTESEVYMDRHNSYYRANVMGYLHYDWKKKFIADVVLAGNGSNRSYPHKWSFSPTASLAYVFAAGQEGPLNFGKVRGSFGIQHSDYVPVQGIWLENYEGGHGNIVLKPSYDGNNWGSYLTHYPLTWFPLETAYKYNLGVDLRLFKSLEMTADVYYNSRRNIMQNANDLNSWVVGRPDSYATEGRVDSYGAELGLRYLNTFSNGLTVRATAYATWGRNEIKSYIELPNEPYQAHVGQRVDQPFGLEAIGFFADEQDIANSPSQQFGQVKPGDIKYKDQNGDGAINDNDQVYFGFGQNVPETNYSFSLGAEYKGFGFNILFQGMAGMTKYLGTVGVWDCVKNNNNLSVHYWENRWQPGADNSNAAYPRLTTLDNPNNFRSNSVWYTNLSWLKLRNVEVYYRFPQKWMNKIKVSDAKIFIKGENLLTISEMKVMDPECLGTSYPIMKGASIGLNINF
ncbi:MAG: SusC/RagA family TonB-linked outer membrane protein [Bacteroidales bacterium]|nr:SusC/RagA family TonB-linked outer membrane protein [Bacteroidales bacterium]